MFKFEDRTWSKLTEFKAARNTNLLKHLNKKSLPRWGCGVGVYYPTKTHQNIHSHHNNTQINRLLAGKGNFQNENKFPIMCIFGGKNVKNDQNSCEVHFIKLCDKSILEQGKHVLIIVNNSDNS